MEKKSSVEEIKKRFDNDVERFSNLDTAQESTVDAPLVIDLIAQTAARCNPQAEHLLDIGCGAGNYTLKVLQYKPDLQVTLVDLSKNMLDRAVERIAKETSQPVTPLQGDIRELDPGTNSYDIVVTAAALHHLRSDNGWEQVFAKVYASLKPGGSFWISDLIDHSITAVQDVMWKQYGDYLASQKGTEYRDLVFKCIEVEDSPRSVSFQIDMLKKVGFSSVDVLHKNSMFAAFGGVK